MTALEAAIEAAAVVIGMGLQSETGRDAARNMVRPYVLAAAPHIERAALERVAQLIDAEATDMGHKASTFRAHDLRSETDAAKADCLEGVADRLADLAERIRASMPPEPPAPGWGPNAIR